MNVDTLLFLVLGFAVLMVFMSLYGVLAPRNLAQSVSGVWGKPWSMAMAVGVRLLLGLVLLATAEQSQLPQVFQVFGWASLVAAIALLIAGKKRVGRLVDWSSGLTPMAMRAWCLVGVVFGLLLGYGAL